MIIYRYDGTLDGLLCVLYDSWENRRLPDLITDSDIFQTGLSNEIISIEMDETKARRVEDGVKKAAGNEGFMLLLQAYSSNNPDKSMIIYRWLLLLFKFGSEVMRMYSSPDVIKFNDITFKVSFETHRFTGFIRFRELDNGIYYAPYRPDNNITVFLMPHFAGRFSGQNLIIHDVSRGIYGLYNTNEWQVIKSENVISGTLSKDELCFEELWKQYYSTVSIESRKNLKLRDRFLPRRYREFLIEQEEMLKA